MVKFHGKRRWEIVPAVFSIITINLIGILLIYLMDSYMMLNLSKLVLIICNIFYIYNIGLWFTVNYSISDTEIKISAWGGLKKVIIPINSILSYTVEEGKIKGIGLSGLFSNRFAVGRIAVKGLGTTRMFVTSSSRVIYIETEELNYGISPSNSQVFEESLKQLNVKQGVWEKVYNKHTKFYKEKRFMIPIIISTISILCITFGPILLYITNKLPDVMPLTLSRNMTALELGTDKQFAFSQMTYGVLNMAVFFCMYYAAQFCAKYDKKSAYNYIYAAMMVALVFLYLQIRLMTIKI